MTTPKKIKLLREACKKEKDATILRRLQMVLYILEGESSWKVGERMQCNHALVLYWKKRYINEDLFGLQTRPRSGKPRKLTKQQEQKIRRKVSKHNPNEGWTTKDVTELIRKETKLDYHPRHVRRILARWDFGLVTPRPTFWQKASGEQIKRFWKKNTPTQERISPP